VDNSQNITVLSLCAGYGGLELGLARALANPLRVVAVEVEAYALANLVAKTEEGKLAIEALWPDLRTFPAERFRGCFDFVIGGYPCTPFSCAGKRQGTDDPRHLWPDIARIIEAVRPLWCFFENVPGHLSLGFPDVYCSLRNMGYSVEAGLFSAAECGAPHRRERLFILAGRQNANRWGHMQVGQAQGRIALDRTSEGMAHPKCSEPGQRIGQEPQTTGRWDRLAECVIPDSASQRIQGNESKGIILAEGQIDESRWPARPGQPQYEWEEPRTIVGDARCTAKRKGQGNGIYGKRQTNQLRKICSDDATKSIASRKLKIELRLGRATSRTASWVDRLRLLGNGVVPQQAELAFRTLWNKMQSTRATASR